MIKYALYTVLALISAVIIIGGVHICRVYLKNKKEMSFYAGQNIEVNKNFGKVLVVYYSLSGNTRAIARKIASMTNADIYEIKTKGKMPSGLKIVRAGAVCSGHVHHPNCAGAGDSDPGHGASVGGISS